MVEYDMMVRKMLDLDSVKGIASLTDAGVVLW